MSRKVKQQNNDLPGQEMNLQRAWITSFLTHLFAIILLWLGVPDFMNIDPEEQPRIVTAQILPASAISNVRPQQKQQPKEEKPKPEPEKHQTPVKREPEPEKTPEPLPEKPKEAAKPLEPTPEEIMKKKPKPKKNVDDDLNALLKSLDTKPHKKKQVEEEETEGAAEGEEAISDRYKPDAPRSLSEQDFIRQQIQKCWNVPAGARDAHELKVVLKVELNKDASLKSVDVAHKSRYSGDSFYRAAADSAVRAVRMCTPLKNLPADKYSGWRSLELTFDPSDMLY